MAEFIKNKVQPIKVIAKCECGGELEPTGICLTTYPCKYPHCCNKCGKVENFHCTYPTIEYEDDGARTPKETHEKHTETHDNTPKERGGEK